MVNTETGLPTQGGDTAPAILDQEDVFHTKVRHQPTERPSWVKHRPMWETRGTVGAVSVVAGMEQ